MGQLTRLLTLLRDPRAPKLPKYVLFAAMIYALSPVDLVPEAVLTPVLGLLDDVTLLWLSTRWLFKNDPNQKPEPPTQPTVSGPPSLR